MKSWRIHLVWSVITLVSSAAWAQRAVRTREIEFREREKVLQVRIVEAKKTAVPAFPEPAPAPAAPIAAVAIQETPASEYEVRGDERPTVEQLRKMIQNGGNDIWRAYQVLSRMVKCPIKAELLRELFQNKQAQVRRSAIHLLREAIGDDEAAPLFQEALRSDPDAEVREAAAQAIGSHNAPGNLEALLQAFQREELRIQVTCAAGLSSLGQPGPAAQLVPRLSAQLESPDGAVRREAVESLCKFTCPQTIPALTRALRDSNGDVRLEALNGLWDIDEVQITTLVEPLLNDPVAAVRESAKELIDAAKNRKP